MKKILFSIITIATLTTSCSKWLDIKPEDKFLEEEVLKTPQGFYEALNGIYLKLGSNELYGRDLSMKNMDILSQCYRITEGHSQYLQQLSSFNYADKDVKESIDNMWKTMYSNITNVNKFIENLDQYGHVLDAESLKLMRAEALGARAYLYFDLLRLFAPNYKQNSDVELLPYYTKATYEVAPFSKSSFIVARIKEDLLTAESLLSTTDPVLTMAKVDETKGTIDLGNKPFLKFRNYHFNYYAIHGLLARINMYTDEKAEALKHAEIVIAAKSKFPWVTEADLSRSSANHIFSTEVLLAFENPKLYSVNNTLFSSALEDREILMSGRDGKALSEIFENWTNDFRYSANWDNNGGKPYPVFIKYKDIESISGNNYRHSVAGIRLGEMFLIAAECTADNQKALSYLNELRQNRKCDLVSNPNMIDMYIYNEYRKEFMGEGQLWFYYKRLGATSILSATTEDQQTMKIENYTFPIPLSETSPR